MGLGKGVMAEFRVDKAFGGMAVFRVGEEEALGVECQIAWAPHV